MLFVNFLVKIVYRLQNAENGIQRFAQSAIFLNGKKCKIASRTKDDKAIQITEN